MESILDALAPAGGPIAWSALGAFAVKLLDTALQWRATETSDDRRTAAILSEAAAIRVELREAESRLRRELFDQEARHREQVAELQAQIDTEREARRHAEASEDAMRRELDQVKRQLATAQQQIRSLKGATRGEA